MSKRASLFSFIDFGSPAEYRRLDLPFAPRREVNGGLSLDEGLLESLAQEAFGEIAYRLPLSQVEALAAIVDSPDATMADRFVAASLIKNAAIAAEGVLPLCQGTGVALVYGWRGDLVSIASDDRGDDEAALSRGASAAYVAGRLRASILEPSGFISERNSGDNGPACVDLRAVPGDEYRFCFAAKGGGSANRTSLSMPIRLATPAGVETLIVT